MEVSWVEFTYILLSKLGRPTQTLRKPYSQFTSMKHKTVPSNGRLLYTLCILYPVLDSPVQDILNVDIRERVHRDDDVASL